MQPEYGVTKIPDFTLQYSFHKLAILVLDMTSTIMRWLHESNQLENKLIDQNEIDEQVIYPTRQMMKLGTPGLVFLNLLLGR